MIRRARRPHWSTADNRKLLAALKEARDWSVKFGRGHSYNSAEQRACHDVHIALDTLAYIVTGNPNALIADTSLA